MRYFSILLIFNFLASCSDKPVQKKLNELLDTARIIRDSNIIESKSLAFPDSMKDQLVTKTLAYTAYACDCPNFVVLSSRDSLINDYKEAYYIEPATKELKLPDILYYGLNEIEFTGIISKTNRLPLFSEFMDPHPPAGPVFTYWSYKVKHPYSFWGPQFKTISLPNDTEEVPSVITVK